MSAIDRRGSVRRNQQGRWSPTTGLLPGLATALLLALALATPVLAHAELTSSDPEDKAVLATPPTVITLKFSEGLSEGKSSFVLTGPGGTVGKGIPTKQGGKVMTLDGLTLEPGAYSIAWTAAATDGHIERGKLSFSVSEPTPAPATPSPSPAPTTAASGAASPAPTAAPTEAPASATPVASKAPAPSPADGGDAATAAGTGSDVLLPIVFALVLVVGLGAFLFSRSRRA
jgi:methionine-rich copper-binding protein CopC